MLHGFYGGVHPADRKKTTSKVKIAAMERPPARVVLPLCGQDGESGEPLVKVGDKVSLGQLLCPATPRYAAVHASVSGTVAAIEPCLQSWGGKALSIVLENDGKDAPARPAWTPAPRRDAPQDLTPGEIVDIVRQAGIAGMGGGAFPAYLKLHSAIGRVDALLLNGAECEPYLTADERLMEERPEAVIGGTRLLMRCLALDRAVIGVEGNKYSAVAALRKQLPLRGGDVEVRTLRARYPQGSEKQLIQKLTGRRVPTGKLPADAGCVVFNVATAAAVYDAVYDAVPLTRRVVTVSGSAVAEPKNLLVPLGTPLEDLIREAGGWRAQPDRVLAGGPMMGAAQFDLSTPVTKGTSAVLGLVAAEVKPANRPEGPCLRCGRCIEACPMGLEPVYLHLYADHGRVRELAGLHIMDCTECGACAYGCPARIRLVHSIRSGKQQLRSLQEKNRGEGGAG